MFYWVSVNMYRLNFIDLENNVRVKLILELVNFFILELRVFRFRDVVV